MAKIEKFPLFEGKIAARLTSFIAMFKHSIDSIISDYEKAGCLTNKNQVFSDLSKEFSPIYIEDSPDDANTRLSISKRWYSRTKHIFANESKWEEFLLSSIKDRESLEQFDAIHKNWQAHAKCSDFTNVGLIYAVNPLVRLITKLFSAGESLFHEQELLNSREGEILKKYLVSTLLKAHNYLNAIMESMLARWELAKTTGDFTEVDLTQKLLNDLARLKIHPDVSLVRPGWLTADAKIEDFAIFGYILQQLNAPGFIVNEALQLKYNREARLNKLLDFGADHLIIKVQGNHFRFIPKSLVAFIPDTYFYPAWIFKGHNLRYEFFKDPRFSQFFLRLTADYSANKGGLNFLTTMEKNRILIAQEIERVESSKSKSLFSRLFMRKTNRLLSGFHDLLMLQDKIILEKQVEYFIKLTAPQKLEQMIAEVSTSCQKLKEYQVILQKGQALQKLLEKDQTVKKLSISLTSSLTSMQTVFETLQKKKNILLNLDTLQTHATSQDLDPGQDSQEKVLDTVSIANEQSTFISVLASKNRLNKTLGEGVKIEFKSDSKQAPKVLRQK